jgi:branched-chain amino acid transport system ATP-binding protein
VNEVSLRIDEGRLVTLIGPNGAGKSTFVNSVAGLMRSTAGEVVFRGRNVRNTSPRALVRNGMAIVPEGRHVVAPLTVAENLRLSSYGVRRTPAAAPAWPVERVYDLFPRLHERRNQVSGTLSGGEQQMLALGRALLTQPDLLLLDEPSMGLALSIVDQVFEAIVEIHNAGTAVLLIEQNVSLAMSVADYSYILQRGRIVLEGTPDELRGAPELEVAYLG